MSSGSLSSVSQTPYNPSYEDDSYGRSFTEADDHVENRTLKIKAVANVITGIVVAVYLAFIVVNAFGMNEMIGANDLAMINMGLFAPHVLLAGVDLFSVKNADSGHERYEKICNCVRHILGLAFFIAVNSYALSDPLAFTAYDIGIVNLVFGVIGIGVCVKHACEGNLFHKL